MSKAVEAGAPTDSQLSEARIKDGSDMKEIVLTEKSANSDEDIIEVHEKKGLLRSAIPRVNLPVSWIILFFNVFLPGSGTLIMSLFALCGVQTDLKKQNRFLAFLINLLAAILQVATAVIIVGWIWSVYWGMYVVTDADCRADRKKKNKRLANLAKSMDEKEKLKDDSAEGVV